MAPHYRWDDLPREELSPLIGRRLVTGERLMITHVYLPKARRAEARARQRAADVHPRGDAAVLARRRRDEVVDVARGRGAHLPSNLPHRAEALEDTLDVDVFAPPRADWLDGSDAYLRG